MTLFLYLLRQLSVALAFSVGGLFFVAIPGVAISAVRRLPGVGMGVVLGYLPIAITDLVPHLLPVGFLLAVVSAYGRFAGDNEWTAASMAGVHPLRMFAPALLVATLLMGPTYWLMAEVEPKTSFRQIQYRIQATSNVLTHLNPGQTEIGFGDFYLRCMYRDPEDLRIWRKVFINLPDQADEPGREIFAETAVIEVRKNVVRIALNGVRSPSVAQDIGVETFVAEIDLDILYNPKGRDPDLYKYVNSRRLAEKLALEPGEPGAIAPKHMNQARFELQQRRTVPATFLLFLMLGLPTGVFLRRGTQLAALAVSVLYALLYSVMSLQLGKTLGRLGSVPPEVAAWAPVVICAAAGLFLSWRVCRR